MDRNFTMLQTDKTYTVSPPARVAWIETMGGWRSSGIGSSPPARVAWIETSIADFPAISSKVATREGGVDRNMHQEESDGMVRAVATREGGVDRNNRYTVKLHKARGRHPRGWRG